MTLPPEWLPEMWSPTAALIVLVATFAMFALETYPPQVVAIAAVGALLATGALSADAMLSVLSNPAPATIAAMFVVSGALVRTGTLDAVSRALRRRAADAPERAILMLILGAMALSAIVNNTPVAMVLIPVAMSLAAALGRAPSKLLIPLSYATILGGVCTLLGTSTNLLVDGVAQRYGLEPFGLFEITPIGLVAAAVGGLYLVFVAPRLLPDRASAATEDGRRGGARFIIEAVAPEGSPLIDCVLSETTLFAENSIRVVDVLRGDESLRRDLRAVVIEPGDRLVLRSDVADLNAMRDEGMLTLGREALQRVQARSSTLMEALIGPGSFVIGRPLLRLRLRRRYGVYPIAAHRRGANLAARFETTPLEIGDTVLLEGAPEDLRRLCDDLTLVALSEGPDRSFRPEKAPIVWTALAGVILLSSVGLMPIVGAAVLAMAVVLVTRCVDADEAMQSIDGGVLLLIYAMLAMGKALETTGAAAILVSLVEPFLMTAPILAVLFAVYAMTSVTTELVTNNAVAVVVAPIVIELAGALGLDPRPLVLLVMVAASASFATPIGYQTNTLVYGPGGYRFLDFVKVGAPLNLLIGAVAVLTVWRLYY